MITDKITSDAGQKIAVIHEDMDEGTAMSSFRNGESKVFGFNDSGLWQYKNRMKKAFGDGLFDTLRPFFCPIQQLSPDTASFRQSPASYNIRRIPWKV